MTINRKGMRPPQIIEEDEEVLQMRKLEISRVIKHWKEYNKAIFRGETRDMESPYQFALNRLDDLNYNLSKIKK